MTAGVKGRDSGARQRRFPLGQSRGGWLYGWISLFLSFIAVGGTADDLGAETTVARPVLIVKVLVYNYAAAPQGTLSRAETEVARVIGATGVAVAWLDCMAPRDRSQPERAGQECDSPVSGATLVLQILPRSARAKAAFRDTVFGYAEGGAWIRIFYDRIEDFAERGDQQEAPVIMGNVIAHEIGHLLLDSASHSASGIMCARWATPRFPFQENGPCKPLPFLNPP